MDDSRVLIKTCAQTIKNGKIVEIGVLGGATLLHLSQDAVKNNNILYAIDPFEKIEIFNGKTESDGKVKKIRDGFESNRIKLDALITKYGLKDTIKVIPETSIKALSLFEDKSIDLIHLDGDHSTEGIYQDLKNYYPKMALNGIIIGHCFTWKSINQGVKKFCLEHELEYTPVNDKFVINC